MFWKITLAGAAAGAVNGIFGGGGGMVLIPMLTGSEALEQKSIFPASVSIMLPVCVVSLAVQACRTELPFGAALPYLLGGVAGGILAGLLGKRISICWLRRALGAMLIWGGLRYLW